MHQAICSKCGKECEIPFKPTGDRPVFCSACFDRQGGGSNDRSNSRFGGERQGRPRDDKQMHETVCAKCGTKCRVPFKPMPGKSVFCDACFGKNSAGGSQEKGGENIKQQFAVLNVKLDQILQALGGGKKEKEATKIVEEKNEIKKNNKVTAKPKSLAKKTVAKKKTPAKKAGAPKK